MLPQRLGAEAVRGESRRDRRGRAGGGARRALRRVPRVLRRAAVPDVTPGQLADRGLAQQHPAGLLEPRDRRRLLGAHLVLERARTPRRAQSGVGEQVLGDERHAVQWPACATGRALGVGAPRLLERQLRGRRDERQQLRVVALDPLEVEARQLDRRHLARREQGSEAGDRQEGQVDRPGRPARRPAVEPLRGALRGDGRVGWRECVRPERERRRDPVVERNGAQRLGVLSQLRQVLQHQLALRVGEGDPGDPLGLRDHRRRDGAGAGLGGQRGERAREDDRPDARRGGRLQDLATSLRPIGRCAAFRACAGAPPARHPWAGLRAGPRRATRSIAPCVVRAATEGGPYVRPRRTPFRRR